MMDYFQSARIRLSRFGQAIGFRLFPSARRAHEDYQCLLAELDQLKRAAKQAEAEHRRHAQLINTALEHIPEFIYIKDRQSRFLANSAAHAAALGWKPEDLIGRTDFDVFPYNLAARLYADEQSMMMTGNPLINREEFLRLADGRHVWMLSSKVPLRDDNGEIVGMVGISRDITELKERERRLEANERFIQQVADTAPDIIYVYNLRSDTYAYANIEAMQRLLGYSSHELQAMYSNWFNRLAHPDDLRQLDGWLQELAQAGDDELCEFTFRLRHKNGEWRWFSARERVFARDADGYVIQTMGVAQDITERLQAEQKLRQHNQYLTALSEITPALMNRLDPDELLNTLLEQAKRLMHADDAFIHLLPDDHVGDGEMNGFLSTMPFVSYHARSGLDKGVAGEVWRTGQPVVVNDYQNWPQHITEYARAGVRAVLGVPIRSGDQVVGVLGVAHSDEEHQFDRHEVDLLARLGELVSIALDNARLYSSARRELEERRRVEAELRASERRYRAVVENQTELICRYLPDFTLTFVNDACCRYFGKPREELLGHSFLSLHEPGNHEMIREALGAFARGEIESHTYVEQAARSGGDFRWLEWTDRPIRAETGQVVEYQAIGRDIHEQRLAELALKTERDFIATIFSTAAAIISVVDREGRFVSINRACENLTGYSSEELIGKTLWETLLLPQDVEGVKRALGLLDKVTFPNTHTNHWRLKDGSLRLIEWTNNVLRDEKGEVALIVASGIDITERKQLEQRNLELALEREKVTLLGNFMRDASHDFRTPLSILNTNLYLIRRSPESAHFELRLAEMEGQVTHLTRLVDQLLTMTRLDSMADLNRAPVDVNMLVENLCNAHQPAASAKGIAVTMAFDPDLPLLNADAFRLSEAIGNIISNAIQYTETGGTIDVRTRLDDDAICIEVEDTGIGIKPDDLDRIFERFYRVDKSRSNASGGAGLGLAIASKIVALHQGKLTARSTLGEGSIFIIRLPLQPEALMV